MRWATRLDRTAAIALLALGAGLAACAREGQARSRPSVRFECQEGCGSYKTVFPGEAPRPCCGLPMESGEGAGSAPPEGAGPGAAPSAPADD